MKERHFMFYDEAETGETFLVCEENLREAFKTASIYFNDEIIFEGEVSEFEAEASGLDEY